jgi:methylsterol monooxygenase
VHKVHHEFKAPVGVASLYCHPAEYFLSNLMPIMAGPLITGCHLVTLWLWMVLALFATIMSHCGYRFPGLPDAHFHDYHHEHYIGNYGVLGLLDLLHRTDQRFVAKSQGVKGRKTL